MLMKGARSASEPPSKKGVTLATGALRAPIRPALPPTTTRRSSRPGRSHAAQVVRLEVLAQRARHPTRLPTAFFPPQAPGTSNSFVVKHLHFARVNEGNVAPAPTATFSVTNLLRARAALASQASWKHRALPPQAMMHRDGAELRGDGDDKRGLRQRERGV